jgi:hypothetical protein
VGGDSLTFKEQSQQQMLSADVAMSHPARFFEGELEYLLDA